MTCRCETLQEKIEAIEAAMRSEGWGFVKRSGAIILVKMTRDECRHKDTDKTKWCLNDACAAGCDVWEGRA